MGLRRVGIIYGALAARWGMRWGWRVRAVLVFAKIDNGVNVRKIPRAPGLSPSVYLQSRHSTYGLRTCARCGNIVWRVVKTRDGVRESDTPHDVGF
jgi:hypothetical protein